MRKLLVTLTMRFTLCFAIVSNAAVSDDDLVLVLAAKQQKWDVVSSLVANGESDINQSQADGATALAWSVYWDNAEMTRLLLDSGADTNIANVYGVTPLFLATNNRSPAITSMLLESGADPDARLWSGVTPVMNVSKDGVNGLLSLLIEHGADINVAEPLRGQTALMWAIAFGHPDTAKILIENSANVNAVTKMRDEDFEPLVLDGYGADVLGTPRGGYSPLMFAARAGDLETIKLLLDNEADINLQANEDGTALVIAAANGFEDIALFLLDNGADPDLTDANGITPLHYAMRDGLKVLHGMRTDFSKQVCGYASDSRCKPYDTMTEEDLKFLEDPSFGLYIVQPKSKPDDPLYGGNMYDLARALLAAGADPDVGMKHPPARLRIERLPYFNLSGLTPFMLAVAALDQTAMDMLLETEVDALVETRPDEEVLNKQINKTADDNQFMSDATSLMVAVGMGRRNDFSPEEEELALNTAEKLIGLGADVNETNAVGWTPLHVAAFLGANRIVEFLVENGAELEVQNGCGQTPLSLAVGRNQRGLIRRTVPHIKTAELLMDLGAGEVKPSDPVGLCVLGRGGLEFDDFQRDRVETEIELSGLQEKLDSKPYGYLVGDTYFMGQ